jgi:predicted nucleic acid-binding protein
MFRKLIDTNILYDAFTENENTEKALQILNEPICVFDGALYELSNLLKNTEVIKPY